MSNTNVESIQFKLTQNITCKVDEPNRDDKTIYNTLVEQNDVGLGAHGEHTYTFPVMLPLNIVLPNFCMCRLFKVEYTYKVTAKLPGIHANLEVQMHPEIGNIQIGQAPAVTGGGFQMGFQVPNTFPPRDDIVNHHHHPTIRWRPNNNIQPLTYIPN
ncbi:unnamed protein product [Callosobruchus maculatus]|uniref:Arrestin C-terminal-like domain-containing protein n=1 Tax=Callosobruchus maculatus TaxID=64391 RepID=A0A653DRG0_CALMS|nr:unnamed protein product [Callosobruchus maculatus]